MQSLSIVVSIQTDRLDTHPEIVVRSSLPAEEVLRVSVAGEELLVEFARRRPGLRIDPQAIACWSVVASARRRAELCRDHARSDFRQLSVERTDRCQVALGTILRVSRKGRDPPGRIQIEIVPRRRMYNEWPNVAKASGQRPLPLTT